MDEIKINSVVKEILGPLELDCTPQQISNIEKLSEIKLKNHKEAIVIGAWEKQQDNDRILRQNYAKWVLIIVAFQIIVIDLAFYLVGFRYLTANVWVANAFILGVFTELAGLVILVFKYLFPDSSKNSDVLLNLLRR